MRENRKSTAPGLDEAPDLSAPEWEAKIEAAPVARGRPRIPNPKQSVTIRLDADIVERFKATGPGWQSRINEALKKA